MTIQRETQRLLTLLGYRPGVIDGVVGVRTREAIRSFQRHELLVVDGKLSPLLLTQLETRIAQEDLKTVVDDASAAAPDDPLNELDDLEDF